MVKETVAADLAAVRRETSSSNLTGAAPAILTHRASLKGRHLCPDGGRSAAQRPSLDDAGAADFMRLVPGRPAVHRA